MTLKTTDFEGQSDGTAVTTGNSGASNTPSAPGGGSITFRDAAAAHGTSGVRSINASGQQAVHRHALDASNVAAAITFFTTGPTNTTAASNLEILQVRHSGGRVGSIMWSSTQSIGLYNGSSLFATVLSSLNRLAKWRVVFLINSSAGTYTARVYYGHSLIPWGEITGSTTWENTAAISHAQLGITSNPAATYTVDQDWLSTNNGATTEIAGPTGHDPDANYVALRGHAANTSTEASTAVDMAAAASIATDNYLIARIAANNSGGSGAASTLTVSDSRNGSWTVLGPALQDPGAADAGIACYLAYVKVSSTYTNGDDVTFSWSPDCTAKSVVIEEWTNIDGTVPVAVTAATNQGASTTPTASITPTASGQLVMALCAIEGPGVTDDYTEDGDSTDGTWVQLDPHTTVNATAANNACIRSAVKRVSGTSAQSWGPTIASRDWATLIVVFAETASPPAMITGVDSDIDSSTSIEVVWTPVLDAEDGYSIVGAPGTHVNDGNDEPPTISGEPNPDYDPMTVDGAYVVVENIDAAEGSYVVTGLTPGAHTHWLIRTGP